MFTPNPSTGMLSLPDELLAKIWVYFSTAELIRSVFPVCQKLREALCSSLEHFAIDLFGRRALQAQSGVARGIAAVAKQCIKLTSLEISNVGWSDAEFDALTLAIEPDVRILRYQNCAVYSPQPLCAPNLRVLSLTKCKQFLSIDLSACDSLTELNLRFVLCLHSSTHVPAFSPPPPPPPPKA
jgi:hypothetical protein